MASPTNRTTVNGSTGCSSPNWKLTTSRPMIVPASLGEYPPATGVTLRIEGEAPTIELELVWRADNPSPAVRLVIAAIRTA